MDSLEKERCELRALGVAILRSTAKCSLLQFTGPPNSPYQDDSFLLHVKFPPSFPRCPPLLRFGNCRIFHTFFEGNTEIVPHNWHSSKSFVQIIQRLRLLLMLPTFLGARANYRMKIYKSDPEEYFRRCAWEHKYSGDVNTEVLESWKQHVEENERQRQLQIMDYHMVRLSKLIQLVKPEWSIRKNFKPYLKCPTFKEIVFILLCEHYRNFDRYGNLFFDIPTPLIWDIITYIAVDFFCIENLREVKALGDGNWISPLYNELFTMLSPSAEPVFIGDYTQDKKKITLTNLNNRKKILLHVSVTLPVYELFSWVDVLLSTSPAVVRLVSFGKEIFTSDESWDRLADTLHCYAQQFYLWDPT
jgi:ubiquitin-protein ligase